jgi:hypothetical protein
MLYRSSLRKLTAYATGLLGLAAIATVVVAKVHSAKAKALADPATFVFCSDDSARYVHDSRTFGIWYQRGRFDSALHFPLLSDTITCTAAQFSPQLFSLGANNLWWFDGILNHKISGGGGGGVSGATNGLDLFSSGASIGLGYAGATPNLFHSVLIKSMWNWYGLNADSNFATGDTIVGPYFVMGPNSPFSTGQFVQYGYNSATVQVNEEQDNTGWYVTANFPDANGGTFSIQDDQLDMNMSAGDFDMTYVPGGTGPNPLPFQIFSGTGMRFKDASNDRLDIAAGVNGQLGVAQNNVYNLDRGNTFGVERLGAYGDSIAAIGGGISATFNAGLNVTTPSGYHVTGSDLSFTISFTTGTVTATGDADSVILRISTIQSSESSYAVTCMPAANKATGLMYSLIQPFISIDNQQTFNLCGAAAALISVNFQSHTTYTLFFHVIDHTS